MRTRRVPPGPASSPRSPPPPRSLSPAPIPRAPAALGTASSTTPGRAVLADPPRSRLPPPPLCARLELHAHTATLPAFRTPPPRFGRASSCRHFSAACWRPPGQPPANNQDHDPPPRRPAHPDHPPTRPAIDLLALDPPRPEHHPRRAGPYWQNQNTTVSMRSTRCRSPRAACTITHTKPQPPHRSAGLAQPRSGTSTGATPTALAHDDPPRRTLPGNLAFDGGVMEGLAGPLRRWPSRPASRSTAHPACLDLPHPLTTGESVQRSRVDFAFAIPPYRIRPQRASASARTARPTNSASGSHRFAGSTTCTAGTTPPPRRRRVSTTDFGDRVSVTAPSDFLVAAAGAAPEPPGRARRFAGNWNAGAIAEQRRARHHPITRGRRPTPRLPGRLARSFDAPRRSASPPAALRLGRVRPCASPTSGPGRLVPRPPERRRRLRHPRACPLPGVLPARELRAGTPTPPAAATRMLRDSCCALPSCWIIYPLPVR